MNIFPGNVLIIDDQFNIGYLSDEPEELSTKTQWENFNRLRRLLDSNGFCYGTITETKDIAYIKSQLEKYQNIRLLILDLDLDESGEVEDGDVEMVKQIIYSSINIFGYYFLAINSSYSEKWEEIRFEMLEELNEEAEKNKRIIHFLSNFCISLDKTNPEIEEKILKLLSDKYSHELITQFECYVNRARDIALSPFLDYTSNTWEHLYKILREDMDSKEHVNFTLNSFMFGLLKQQLIGANYTVPPDNGAQIDPVLQQSIIRGFNYLSNSNKLLDNHPVWTGNLYFDAKGDEASNYFLVITPECDIAQQKSAGYTVITAFEADFPERYNPDEYNDEKLPPLMVRIAGKKAGKWKPKSEIETFYKSPGFYFLLHSSVNNKHLILDLRSAFRMSIKKDNGLLLHLRVNEPIITDISDKFSSIFNRKGIPRLTPKNYTKL